MTRVERMGNLINKFNAFDVADQRKLFHAALLRVPDLDLLMLEEEALHIELDNDFQKRTKNDIMTKCLNCGKKFESHSETCSIENVKGTFPDLRFEKRKTEGGK